MEQPPSSLGLALPVAELPFEVLPPVVALVLLLGAVLVVPPAAAPVAPPAAELAPPMLEWPPDGGGATSARAVAVNTKKDTAAIAPSNVEVLTLLSPFRGQRSQSEVPALNAQQAQTKEHANSTNHDPE